MKNGMSIDEVQKLKQQLHLVRQQSLLASRQNDFRTVARLTTEAARLNRAIQSQENFADCALRSLTVVDALKQLDGSSHFVFPDEPAPSSGRDELEPTLQEAA
jgi:hypothetical protein